MSPNRSAGVFSPSRPSNNRDRARRRGVLAHVGHAQASVESLLNALIAALEHDMQASDPDPHSTILKDGSLVIARGFELIPEVFHDRG